LPIQTEGSDSFIEKKLHEDSIISGNVTQNTDVQAAATFDSNIQASPEEHRSKNHSPNDVTRAPFSSTNTNRLNLQTEDEMMREEISQFHSLAGPFRN